MPGTLVFRPIEANLNVTDKDVIGKMDPYCLFHVGGQNFKSQVCKSGGKNPHWNDSISVQMPPSGGVVQVELKDKDMLVDDKLGSFELDLNEVTSLGQVRKWYPIFSKDRPAGEILIETTFSGSGYSQGIGNQGLQQGFQQGMGHQGLQQGYGIHQTQSTMVNRVVPPGGEAVLSEIHTNPHQTHTTHIPHQSHQSYGSQMPLGQQPYGGQGFMPQSTQLSGGQPLQFSGVQPSVIPAGGVGSGVEQYATEALMRGVDPMNTQQHYHYNIANGSQNPGFSGIPMNYSMGNAGNNPQSLTQTPLYSGSQPLNYEGNAGHAETLANTHTTGHHNEGFMSKLQQKEAKLDQKFGTHTHTHETKNLKTGDFHHN